MQLMTALDSVRENSPYGVAMFVPGGSGTPPFFSGNAASVSRILGFVESVEIRRTELADAATETITYRTR